MAFRERRPGVVQVLAPLSHEDGDMVDIFIDEPRNGSNRVRISDHGMTLMRLTYNYDLDAENKLRIFSRSRPRTGSRNRTGGFTSKRNPSASIRRFCNLHALRQLTTLQQRPRPTEDDDALEITHASGTWESGPFPVQPGVTPGPTPLPDSPPPTGSGAGRPAASTTPQPSISPNEPGDLVQTKAPASRTFHTINSPRSPHPAARRRRQSLRPAFRAVFSRRHRV